MKKVNIIRCISLMVITLSLSSCEFVIKRSESSSSEPTSSFVLVSDNTSVINNSSVISNNTSSIGNVTSPSSKSSEYTSINSVSSFDSSFISSTSSNSSSSSSISSESSSSSSSSSIKKEPVVISNLDKEIPADVKFTGDDSGRYHSNVDVKDIHVNGSYSTNFSKYGSSVGEPNSISVCYYRATSSCTLTPDKSDFKNTSYRGHDGALYNDEAIGNIVSFDITYTAGTKVGNIKPSVTFGQYPTCDDYRYVLDTDDSTAHISVPNSGYNYFCINSGSYNLGISNFSVHYNEANASNLGARSLSGEGKIRCNPVVCKDSTLVPGQSKVTVPMNLVYDPNSDTYYATESKTYTYYTTDYVRSHSEVIDEAALTDPLDVCVYYSAFKTWPANYAISNRPSDVFGSRAREVSKYNRTNGYATSVPWCQQGYYYELDIDVDGTYSSGGRGTGRVVAWDKGWTANGYDSSPVCLFTDDHYSTWLEYLNNGSWSYRFNGEGNISGRTFKAATTVSLTNFETGTSGNTGGSTGGNTGGGTIGEDDDTIDHSLYYGNIAPKEVENVNKARYQRVTQAQGVYEDSKYLLVIESARVYYPYGNRIDDYDGFKVNVNPSDIARAYGLEKASNGYKLYTIDVKNNSKEYLSVRPNKNAFDYNDSTTWQISFVNGKFKIYDPNSGRSIRYNTANGGKLSPYSGNSYELPCLYRLCNVEGVDNSFEFERYENEMMGINEKLGHLIVDSVSGTCLNDSSSGKTKYSFSLDNKDLVIDGEAPSALIYFESLENEYNRYSIYFLIKGEKYYLNYDYENGTKDIILSEECNTYFCVDVGYYGNLVLLVTKKDSLDIMVDEEKQMMFTLICELDEDGEYYYIFDWKKMVEEYNYYLDLYLFKEKTQ